MGVPISVPKKKMIATNGQNTETDNRKIERSTLTGT